MEGDSIPRQNTSQSGSQQTNSHLNLVAGKKRLPVDELQALQEVGYATPISGTMGDQLDLVLECATDWEDEGRRVFSKRSSGIQLDELLAFAAQAQARSHRQLKLLQVREIKVWRD